MYIRKEKQTLMSKAPNTTPFKEALFVMNIKK